MFTWTLRILIVLILNGGITSCASLFNNEPRHVEIRTEQPVRARVNLPSHQLIETQLPTTVAVRPSSFNQMRIEVTDPCFQKTILTVDRRISPIYFLNIFNIYGFGVDWASGEMWNYDSPVFVPISALSDPATNCQFNSTPLPSNPVPQQLNSSSRRFRVNGLGLNAMGRTVENTNVSGFLLYYRRWPSQRVRYQLALTGDGYSHFDYYGGRIENYRSTFSASVSVTPFESRKFLIGAGIGCSTFTTTIYPVYTIYNPTTQTESLHDKYCPLFLELGSELGEDVFFDISVHASATTLGLQPHDMRADAKRRLAQFNTDTKQRGLRIFYDNYAYSAVTVGVGLRF